MGEDDLNTFALQLPDSPDCFLCFPAVGMNATSVSLAVQPLANLLLIAHNPPVMAGIACEVNPLVMFATDYEVDVAREMAGRVNDVDCSVPKEIKRRRKIAEGSPRAGEIDGRNAFFGAARSSYPVVAESVLVGI